MALAVPSRPRRAPFAALGRSDRAERRGRNVVGAAFLVPGVRPPVGEQLFRSRDHPGNEDEQVDGNASTHQRRRESAEGMAYHQDGTAAVFDGLDYGVGVIPPPGRLVLDGQIDRDCDVSALAQQGATRCQSHALPPPPWISAKVATVGHASRCAPWQLRGIRREL